MIARPKVVLLPETMLPTPRLLLIIQKGPCCNLNWPAKGRRRVGADLLHLHDLVPKLLRVRLDVGMSTH